MNIYLLILHANKYDPKYHLQGVFESDVIFLNLQGIYPCLPRTNHLPTTRAEIVLTLAVCEILHF